MGKFQCRKHHSEMYVALFLNILLTGFAAFYLLLGKSRCLIINANQHYQLVPKSGAAFDSCSSAKSHHNPSKCTCHCQGDHLINKVLSGNYRGKTPSSIFLMILIFSRPSSFTLCNSCRKTWMMAYHGNSEVLFKFVIGLGGVDEAVHKEIESESDIHGDLLIFDDHEERYGSQCTKKLQLTLQWASAHTKSLFLMKTDDDVYVRLGYILVLLHKRWSLTAKPFLCGTIACNEAPAESGKWAENDWWLTEKYLPFPFGSGYIIPMNLVHAVVASNSYAPLRKLTNKDVSLGI